MKDISDKAEVEQLVRAFYSKAVINEDLKLFFINTDFEKHFPRMFSFWNFILLDEPGFVGNVFDKHVGIGIESHHFPIWLKLFNETVDELFKGEKAELAKQRAFVIAHTFESKLKTID